MIRLAGWSIAALLAMYSLMLPLRASHLMAGDISYRSLSPGNRYEITLRLYRDCSGLALAPTVTVLLNSTCRADSNIVLHLAAGYPAELPLICGAQRLNSACNGGSQASIQEYVYRDTLTLPPCQEWRFSWTTCCRNAAISNLTAPDSRGFYLEATLDNLNASGNHSPSFGALPALYVCRNSPWLYDQGTLEPDGDSLVFSLVNPLEISSSPIAFRPGFSATQPISGGLSFQSSSGAISVTPNALQVCVLSVLVEEYRNGLKIGSTMRDMQVIVVNCQNQAPALVPDSVLFVLPPTVQTGARSVEICPGQTLFVGFRAEDPDPGDSVFITFEGTQQLLGATVFSLPGPDTAAAYLSWTPTALNSGQYLLRAVVRDNHCPYVGVQRYTWSINVRSRTTAGPDQIYCPAGGPVRLVAAGGNSFKWTRLDNLPLAPGELSCDTCQVTFAVPPATRAYVVTSNLIGCINRDTVVVEVVPNLQFTLSTLNTLICRGQPATLKAIAQPSTDTQIIWQTQGANIRSDSTAMITPGQSAWHYVTAISSDGCRVRDSVRVQVNTLAVNARAATDKVCSGNTVKLWAEVLSGVATSKNWRNPSGVSMGGADTLNITPTQAGFYRISVSDGVCTARDSVRLYILNLQASITPNLVCPGDTVQAQAVYSGPSGLSYPTACRPAEAECCGPGFLHYVGDTCTLILNPGLPNNQCRNSSGLSTPYKGFNRGAQSQYIYTRNQLQAAGFQGGTIEAIAFHVLRAFPDTSLPSLVSIRMGCTTKDSSRHFLDGLTTVWGPAPFSPQTGFNRHELDQPYDWDGVNNLVIQVCVGRNRYHTWGYYPVSTFNPPEPAATYAQSVQIPVQRCELTQTVVSYDLPSLRLETCVQGLQPTYTWSPATGMKNPNVANPRISIENNILYTVAVKVANCVCTLSRQAGVMIDNCALPVTFRQVEVSTPDGKHAHLKWQLTDAVPGGVMVVERFAEGAWMPEGREDAGFAEGNFSSGPLPAGHYLWRLQLQFPDGQQLYSEIREVTLEGLQPFLFFTTPGGFAAECMEEGEWQLIVYDANGRALLQLSQLVRGRRVRLDALPAGLYVAQATAPGRRQLQKLILR